MGTQGWGPGVSAHSAAARKPLAKQLSEKTFGETAEDQPWHEGFASHRGGGSWWGRLRTRTPGRGPRPRGQPVSTAVGQGQPEGRQRRTGLGREGVRTSGPDGEFVGMLKLLGLKDWDTHRVCAGRARARPGFQEATLGAACRSRRTRRRPGGLNRVVLQRQH